MTAILQKGNSILTQVAREIKREEISSKYVRDTIERMRDALNKEEDGFAIAAPQIGESIRIFLVSGKPLGQIKGVEGSLPDRVYINPVIIKRSKETKMMEEGCLSVRSWFGFVERNKKIKIEALDQDGKVFQEGASGVLSQVFQHEIDHLDGILFTDKAVNLKKETPKDLEHEK